jgi:6-pyruvoyltetrahydropterin/6-carboxytetrahydropterin synthase
MKEAPHQDQRVLKEATPGISPFWYVVTINDSIEAAHQLKLPYESKCNNLHGHTYRVRVVIGADQLNEHGMVVDFTHVKTIVRQYDHRNLNDFFEPATAEKFGEVLLDSIQQEVLRRNSAARVIEVAVSETASTWASVQYSLK